MSLSVPEHPDEAGASRPGLYEIRADGSLHGVAGQRLIATLGDGRELAFTLPEPGGREGEIYVRSMFSGPGGDAHCEEGRGPLPETWSSIVVHPGGGNVMTVTVEARSASDGHLVVGPAEVGAVLSKSWYVVEGSVRRSVEARSFLVSLGEGRSLTLDAVASSRGRDGVHVLAGTIPRREEVRADVPLTCVPMGVGFGAANVLYVRLGKPYEARPIESPRSRPFA